MMRVVWVLRIWALDGKMRPMRIWAPYEGLGSKLTPAPCEKAQASEEKIYMQAVQAAKYVGAVYECVVSE